MVLLTPDARRRLDSEWDEAFKHAASQLAEACGGDVNATRTDPVAVAERLKRVDAHVHRWVAKHQELLNAGLLTGEKALRVVRLLQEHACHRPHAVLVQRAGFSGPSAPASSRTLGAGDVPPIDTTVRGSKAPPSGIEPCSSGTTVAGVTCDTQSLDGKDGNVYIWRRTCVEKRLQEDSVVKASAK